MRKIVIGGGAVALVGAVVLVAAAQPDTTAAGKAAFGDVYKVLMSPRCMNCHPNGDRPLQFDDHKPHAQNISRASIAAGLPCATCHQDKNSETIGVAGGPPGAPRWGLPPAETPMIFQGKSPHDLCEQLRDPERNGHKSLPQLFEHIDKDPLVLWGWNPGGKRTTPPLAHDKFAAAFKTWIDSEAACP